MYNKAESRTKKRKEFVRSSLSFSSHEYFVAVVRVLLGSCVSFANKLFLDA
jgi:hypothetical protein